MILDRNMETAYSWATELRRTCKLPEGLNDTNTSARLVDDVNNFLGPILNNFSNGRGQLEDLSLDMKTKVLKGIREISKHYMQYENEDDSVTSVALRLWSGCLTAAKNIASGTRGGPNTSESRAAAFINIDMRAKLDSVYCAGVKTAIAWKKLIGQADDIFLDGIPQQSHIKEGECGE